MEIFGISLLYSSNRVLPLAMLNVFKMATAKVLVFIPPPVEAGEAPTHIKNITIRIVCKLSAPVSTVLKPAVLVVTEPKNAVTIFPRKEWLDRVLLNSRIKNAIVPKTVRIREVTRTIRVFTFINLGEVSEFFRRKIDINKFKTFDLMNLNRLKTMGKPSPPIMNRNDMIRCKG